MLYLSIAIVICVAFIVWRGFRVTVTHRYDYPDPVVEPVTSDMYNNEGDLKAEFNGKEVEMREFLQDINSFMVGDDNTEIENNG